MSCHHFVFSQNDRILSPLILKIQNLVVAFCVNATNTQAFSCNYALSTSLVLFIGDIINPYKIRALSSPIKARFPKFDPFLFDPDSFRYLLLISDHHFLPSIHIFFSRLILLFDLAVS